MNFLWYIAAAAAGVAAGVAVMWLRGQAAVERLKHAEDQLRDLESQRDRAVRAETELEVVKISLEENFRTRLAAEQAVHRGAAETREARIAALQEAAAVREREVREARQEAEKAWETKVALLREEFKSLSAKILEERSGALAELNKEQLGGLLNPLRERMGEFKAAVDEAKLKGVELNTDLKAQLGKVLETTRQLGSEANNLAAALKGGNKLQGNWGEMILEKLLENSGLIRGQHYEVQETIRDTGGAAVRGEDSRIMRPDVIVHYPDGREVIIDSKVSLSAYIDYVNAEEDAVRAEALARHLRSVQAHVDELARKNYAEYLKGKSREAIDFVIMFIPNEAPHQLAMVSDPSLWRNAFDKRVLIVSPVNLMALLQIIHIAWRRDAQERNQQAILDTAAQLLDRLYAFYASFDDMGRRLGDAQKAYDAALGCLRGGEGRHSIVVPGEKLKKLGVKMKRSRPLPVGLEAEAEAEALLADDAE